MARATSRPSWTCTAASFTASGTSRELFRISSFLANGSFAPWSRTSLLPRGSQLTTPNSSSVHVFRSLAVVFFDAISVPPSAVRHDTATTGRVGVGVPRPRAACRSLPPGARGTKRVVPKSLPQLARSLGGVRRALDLRRFVPMRPVTGRPPLAGDGWLYELKLDGYRLLADVRGRDVALRYRSGHDCTEAFPEIVDTLRRLRVGRVVLDGEVVAFDEEGRPDFDRLSARHRSGRARGEAPPPASFHVFDVLAVGELDVRPVPLVNRKALVERVVERSRGGLRVVPWALGDGRALARFIVEHDLEGLVAKRADSAYRGGASTDWVKVKRRHEEEFVVTRYRTDRDGRIEALALAARERGRLVPSGIVELGAWRVRDAVGDVASRRAGWAAPPRTVVVSVTFTGRTSAGRLREAHVKGLRLD